MEVPYLSKRDNATAMLENWSAEHGAEATNRRLIKAMLEEGMTSSAAQIFGDDLVDAVQPEVNVD